MVTASERRRSAEEEVEGAGHGKLYSPAHAVPVNTACTDAAGSLVLMLIKAKVLEKLLSQQPTPDPSSELTGAAHAPVASYEDALDTIKKRLAVILPQARVSEIVDMAADEVRQTLQSLPRRHVAAGKPAPVPRGTSRL